jgi:hypothetical protein
MLKASYLVVLLGFVFVVGGCPPDSDDDAIAVDDDSSVVDDDDSASDDDDSAHVTDDDGDGWSLEEGDCDDGDPSIHPDADEIPFDGIDQDCDGQDSFDGDGDGYDSDEMGGDDCDDEDPIIHPDAYDIPYDGIDQDCDGADKTDVDFDGYDSTEAGGEDCDDTNSDVHPGAEEACDGVADNDCDGVDDPDEADDDGDGWTECVGDCDDDDPDINPDAIETCDGVDTDCDGELLYGEADADGDGSLLCEGDCDDRDPSRSQLDLDADSYSTCAGDCDDGDPTVNPSMAEVVNGKDDDCDGELDADAVTCTWTVPTDHATIQGAIAAALDGDVVCVEPGSYLETLDFLGKAIEVLGLQGRASTWIDGGSAASVVSFISGEGADTLLRGFTLAYGLADDGGGIHIDGASPTLQDLSIHSCFASGNGGGISLYESGAVLNRLYLDGNESTLDGGGLWIDSSTDVEMESMWLQGNVAGGGGGGGYLVESSASMSEVGFLENVSVGPGGGLDIDDDSDLTLQGGIFIRNQTTGYEASGGGLYVHTAMATLEDAYFDSNSGWDAGGVVLIGADGVQMSRVVIVHHEHDDYYWCAGAGLTIGSSDNVVLDHLTSMKNRGGYGGAICNKGGDNLVVSNSILSENETLGGDGGAVWLFYNGSVTTTFENCLISNNYSLNGGGGIAASSVALVLIHTVVAGNEALGGGGGVHSTHGSVTAYNSIIAENRAGPDGGGLDLAWSDLTLTNTIITQNSTSYVTGGGISGGGGSISHCNVYGNTPDNYGTYPDPTGTDGNLSVDPMFLDTTALDPFDWDLHLDPLSPLVDAGDPTLLDPDGSPSDMGVFGGLGAELWDLDWDGFPLWWQPGPYDHATYPDEGWDCDDLDSDVFPGAGC